MAQPKLRIQFEPAEGLSLSQDDFSIRVASSKDQIFWVRVERELEGAIVVTDFNPGERPIFELEAGILMAVDAMTAIAPKIVVFKDLIPRGDGQQGLPIRLVRSVDLVRTLASSIAAKMGLIVSGFRLERTPHGKLDAVLTLAEP